MAKAQTTIVIDKSLASEIDKLIKIIPGYLNRSEFARDAIRREVLRIKQKLKAEGADSR